MPHVLIARNLTAPILVLLITLTAAVTGCSKKEAKPAAVAAPVEATSAAPAAETPPPTTSIPVSTDIQKSFAEVDAALKAKAYEKAVQNLLAVQRQAQLTAQQAQEARNRMVGLQRNLAQAVASGDPNAKAAAEMLRRSSMVQ